jgi:hypothetical protein
MKRQALVAAVLSITVTATMAVTGATTAFADTGKTSPSANATVLDVVNTFKNQATARCIDDSSAGFRTWTCNSSANQQWNVHVWGDGTRQLKSQATGRCIDDSSAGFRTWTCWPGSNPSSANQSWYVTAWGDGTIQFKNQATGRCIDDSAAGFRTWTCWPGSNPSSANQSWY